MRLEFARSWVRFPAGLRCVFSSDPAVSSSIFVGAEREENLITNRMFRPHGLPQQNRKQSGEGRSYTPVPRQRDIGAPVPGTVKQVRGEEEEVKGSD